MNDNFVAFKDRYKDGYRCIYKEKSDACTFTLRDFNKGKICTISTNNNMEIGQIEDFLDEIATIQKKTGHDCICTGWEGDD